MEIFKITYWDSDHGGPKECIRDYIAILGLYNDDFDIAYAWNFTKGELHRVFSGGAEVSQPNNREVLMDAIAPEGYVWSGETGCIHAGFPSMWAYADTWYTPYGGYQHFDRTYTNPDNPYDPEEIDPYTREQWSYSPEIPLTREVEIDYVYDQINYDPITSEPSGPVSSVHIVHEAIYTMQETLPPSSGDPLETRTLSREVVVSGINLPETIEYEKSDPEPFEYIETTGHPEERFPLSGDCGATWHPDRKEMVAFAGVYDIETGENMVSKVWWRKHESGEWQEWEELEIPDNLAINYVWTMLSRPYD